MSRYTTIPDLAQRMDAVGATNETLAVAAGVAYATVSRHRAGKSRLMAPIAALLLETLATRKFKRKKNIVRPDLAEIIRLRARVAELEKQLEAKCSTTSK